MKWFFEELAPLEPERNPHEEEFFRSKLRTEAFVREFIQNSLDAARKDNGNVRISVSFTFGEVSRNKAEKFFDDLSPHLQACGLSVLDDTSKIPYLTAEDFGTTGLVGITSRSDQNRSKSEDKKDFYNFWLAEGKSGKSGREAGRWGLGKTTFHGVSKIKSFWGLTVRYDDNRHLLMGKALLKSHRLDEKIYRYCGYFLSNDKEPVEDKSKIELYKKCFSVARDDAEPGLTLTIPFPDEEIKVVDIIRYTVLHYFYPIMRDMIEVHVEKEDYYKTINVDHIHEIAASVDWDDTPWKDVDVEELLKFVQDAIDTEDKKLIKINTPNNYRPEITQGSFGEKIEELRERFNSGHFMAFRVPVEILKSGGKIHRTFFKIFIKKYPELSGAEEYYIRSGITIPEIKNLRRFPVRAMLVAEEDAISEFLGDAENPAHTKWVENTEGFKGKYENAVQVLRFIRRSMYDIISILDKPESKLLEDFLKDVFYVPEERPSGEEKTAGIKIPGIESKPKKFSISKINSGFRVTLNKKDISFPLRSQIKVAYDVRRGNPFTRYNILDFDLSENIFSLESAGCRILGRAKNIIKFEVEGPDFYLAVTGFDSKRDLIVYVSG